MLIQLATSRADGEELPFLQFSTEMLELLVIPDLFQAAGLDVSCHVIRTWTDVAVGQDIGRGPWRHAYIAVRSREEERLRVIIPDFLSGEVGMKDYRHFASIRLDFFDLVGKVFNVELFRFVPVSGPLKRFGLEDVSEEGRMSFKFIVAKKGKMQEDETFGVERLGDVDNIL